MAIKYKRIPFNNAEGSTGFRYTKDNKLTKESRIPHEVMERFELVPEMDYDDMPEKRRCIFCDAPQNRQKYLNSQLYDLCEWHYQHASLGEVAHQVAILEQEAKAIKKPVAKKKKVAKKTALSAML